MESSKRLGDHTLPKKCFERLDGLLKELKKKEFTSLPDRKKSERVNAALLELIQNEPPPCFLLPHVIDYIDKINREELLLHYTFASFEIWLNHNSNLSDQDNFAIRAKIAGKYIDRSDYQVLFPIGMGKVYPGTHFVTAHKSPDLDTTVASFWGWLDAFAARVGDSLHIWNLPGGPPPSQIEIEWLFKDPLGDGVFTYVAKTRNALTLTGNDLMTQAGFSRKVPTESISSIDHERVQTAVVVVDEEGYYLGDWRSMDAEGVRQVIILLSSCIRWFENTLHLQLITLLAKKELKVDEVAPSLEPLFTLKLQDCEPAAEFSSKQRKQVDTFITRILKIPEGLGTHFEKLGLELAKLGDAPFTPLEKTVENMKKLFDSKGVLIEDRPQIFLFLEEAVSRLHQAIFQIRGRLEKVDIALRTKMEVFGHQLNYVTVRSEVEEIKSKMSTYPYLTVNYPEEGKLYPVGVISAESLRKPILGTVSLRDFCNREEMAIPSYLDVISVIDHHKSALQTFSPPMAIIADAQSSNCLVADRAFQINDRYSLGGQTKEEIEKLVATYSKETSSQSLRLLQRVLKKKVAASEDKGYFVHPDREYLEYLQFLYAILDDTDLLTKVSVFDVECIASLLNRLKSLQLGKEAEIVDLGDIPRDKEYPKKAAERILQNEDMYSLYAKVYAFREKEVEKNIALCAKGEESNLFADTKEQSGCARIGQTKMFAVNIPFFHKHIEEIRKSWVATSQEVYSLRPEIDLHIHMLSTIVSAEDVYQGKKTEYAHKDELWFWIPQTEIAVEHLKRFLNAFQASLGEKGGSFEAEFFGDNGQELSSIFRESFLSIPHKVTEKGSPVAVLRFKAGVINSRKTMISPFLPNLRV